MDTHNRILVVDDEDEIRELVANYLNANEFVAEAVADGRAMWEAIARETPHLVLLDQMLPGENGLKLCQALRAQSDLPVIMLTALGSEIDRVLGLEMGADDYITKPFSPRELLARIRAQLRRTRRAANVAGADSRSQLARFGGWTLDLFARHLVSADGVVIALSGAEFRLLLAFLRHPRHVLTRERLADLARCKFQDATDRGLDVLVSRLRRRVRDDGRVSQLIRTVRNEGYVFTLDPAFE